MELRGRIWKYGDCVNTDVIFPGKYTYTLNDPTEVAAHALEDLDPSFAANARAGDIIVAGKNWGNGSSREQAVTCLIHKGIPAVIARSFARIYYRNAINQGLLLLTCPEVVEVAQNGDVLEIDLPSNHIYLQGRAYSFPPLSLTALGILDAGGLIPYLQQKIGVRDTFRPVDGE